MNCVGTKSFTVNGVSYFLQTIPAHPDMYKSIDTVVDQDAIIIYPTVFHLNNQDGLHMI